MLKAHISLDYARERAKTNWTRFILVCKTKGF